MNEADGSNYFIHLWCKRGAEKTHAFCILSSSVISYAQCGIAAIEYDTTMKKNAESAARLGNEDENLQPSKLTQGVADSRPRL